MKTIKTEELPQGSLTLIAEGNELYELVESIRNLLSLNYSGYHTALVADCSIDGENSCIWTGNLKPFPNDAYDNPTDVVRICAETRLCMMIERLRKAGKKVRVRHIFFSAQYKPEKDQLIKLFGNVKIRTPCGNCCHILDQTPEIDPNETYLTMFSPLDEEGHPEAILTVKVGALLEAWRQDGSFWH